MSMTNELITAKDFMETKVFNKETIESQLLDAAKKLAIGTIRKAYHNEIYWETINDNGFIIATITICRSKNWDPNFPNESIGDVEKCKALFCTKLFPMNDFEEWLHSYGWEFDFTQKETDGILKIWIDLVSHPIPNPYDTDDN